MRRDGLSHVSCWFRTIDFERFSELELSGRGKIRHLAIDGSA
jgi:hypothetical protein